MSRKSQEEKQNSQDFADFAREKESEFEKESEQLDAPKESAIAQAATRQNNFCAHCGVYVKRDLANCPMCGRYVGGGGVSETSYVPYPSGRTGVRSRGLNIAVNLTVLVMLLAVVLNAAWFIVTKSFDYRLLFGIYILLGGCLLLFCILLPVRRRRFKWKEAAWTYVFLTLLAIAVDLLTDLKIDFSVAYTAPALAFATGLAASVVALVRRKLDLSNPLLTLLISVLILIGLTVLNTCLFYSGVFAHVTLVPVYALLAADAALLTLMLLTRFKEQVKNLVKKFHV